MEDEANKPPFDPSETAETIEELAANPASLESEVSRLNTKVSALETKLDVITANLERSQMQRAQPVIEAQATPQENMAAPVEEFPEESQVSSAPIRPVPLAAPPPAKIFDTKSSGAEKEFSGAMELFQGGKNLEAASRFALFAKKFPQHLLASHALYWAGESSARAQQWSLALQNWEELETQYPRSAYLPEALAGLAKAHERQGNPAKAKAYRDTLARAFPKSPVALTLQMGSEGKSSRREAPAPTAEENIPSYDEEAGNSEEMVTE
jgi:TolA-binding protein